MKTTMAPAVLLGWSLVVLAFGSEVDGSQEESQQISQRKGSGVPQPPVTAPQDQWPFAEMESPASNASRLRSRQALAKLHKRRRQVRIIGGLQVRPGQFPWQVRMLVRQGGRLGHKCGGAIISQHWILTAAHCLRGIKKEQIILVVGDITQKVKDEGEHDYFVEDMISHADFNKSSLLDSDIALLKVRKENGRGIMFDGNVHPVHLPESGTAYTPGTKCYVSGWGRMDVHSLSDVLRWSSVQLVAQSYCKQWYNTQITPRVVCAEDKGGEKRVYKGDSGGPLVCEEKGLSTLMGIVSFAGRCSRCPQVYTKVKEFLPWIHKTILDYSAGEEQELPQSRV